MKLRLNNDDPYLKLKEIMLGINRNDCIKEFHFFEDINNKFTHNNKVLGYLRFIEFDGNFNNIIKCFSPTIKDIKTCKSMNRELQLSAVSIKNEKQMLNKLKEIAEKCLNKFPQTYEEDIKLLENTDLSFNKRNCLIFRSGEKKIYKLMIAMANLGLTVLSKDAKSLKIDLKSLAESTPFGSYIKKCLIPLVNRWK